MITVAETPDFQAQAKAEGMTRAEIDHAIDLISADPTGGVSLGSGLYKVRVPREGSGKRGGYRVVVFYMDEDRPVYLLAVLSKANTANFSALEVKSMRSHAGAIKEKR